MAVGEEGEEDALSLPQELDYIVYLCCIQHALMN
jgi:hypothetical protein